MKRKLAPGSDFSSKEVQQHMSRDENSTRDAQCADGLVCRAFPERGFIRQHDVAQHRYRWKVKGGSGGSSYPGQAQLPTKQTRQHGRRSTDGISHE